MRRSSYIRKVFLTPHYTQRRPPPHPVCHLLASLPQLSQLSSYHFTRLISARESHFLNPSFSTLQDLADYSAGTQASLLYLLLQATAQPASTEKLPHARPFEHTGSEHMHLSDSDLSSGSSVGGGSSPELKAPDDLTLDHAAAHLAVANTIAVLLRSIPHHAGKRINVIPAEIGQSSAADRYELQCSCVEIIQPQDIISGKRASSDKDRTQKDSGSVSQRW